jgi:DNA-binding MarR family transcriptional regulator
VAVALLSHANAETGAIYPSQEVLAVEIGVSVPTVKRAIRALIDKGWLRVERKNRHVQNRYEFLTDHFEAIEDIHREVRDVRSARREGSRQKNPEGSNPAPVIPRNTSGGITGDTSEGSRVTPEHLNVTPTVQEASNKDNTEIEVLSPADPSAASFISKADPSHRDPTIPVENGVQLTQPLMVRLDGRRAHVCNVDGEVIGTFPTEAQATLGLVRLRKNHGLTDPPTWTSPNPITGRPIVPPDFDAMLEEQVAKQERRDRMNRRDAA